MFVSLRFMFFIAVFGEVVRVDGSMDFTNYLTRLDRQIKQHLVVEQYTLRSKLECVVLCASISFCKGASWGTVASLCQLTDRNCVDNGVNNWNLQVADNWVTVAEPEYPVALYRGPLGRYTLSFAEAQSFCVQLDSVIASPSELLLARSMGYESCSCGWLSDGKNGFVLQNPDWGCWGSYSTEINICNYYTAEVYCHPV